MKETLHKILAIVGLMACGSKNDASKLSQKDIFPDNSPVRSECLGVDASKNRSVPVDWDDQSPLRVCLVLQADGALAFDLRLRASMPELRRQAVNVELRGPSGRSAAGVFPLLWNPFNGIYELQLSQGCLVGTPGGCAKSAPNDMRRLFAAIPHSEDYWHPNVEMLVSLVNPDGSKTQVEAPRFRFNWDSQSFKMSDRSIN